MTMSTPQTEGQMQQWQALLDSAAEGIWGVDLEGNCTFVNRMAVSTFGFESEELAGRNMHELVHHRYPNGRSFPGSDTAWRRSWNYVHRLVAGEGQF